MNGILVFKGSHLLASSADEISSREFPARYLS
jgi:hypothetical protein